ncbi:uncharacterized protein septin12 isoform X1 [Osmerus eperlanus]|uniref:uncharacterized protein septin12 isoform X1 n=2 Tax=Osmerus eperlanus TaxID=29151 RepID=UPI002E14A261
MMSEISVNDHLEGILSDFEALKRSFDIEDVDDIPAFSPTSPIPSPISPSTHLLNKSNEGRGLLPPSHNISVSSPSYRQRISLGSSPSLSQSPVLKSRMVSSFSFNRGTANRSAVAVNNNIDGGGGGNGGIARAASFQSRFNPNGFSSSFMSGPGSDYDSLHSSSSSLDYSVQGGGGGAPLSPLHKLGGGSCSHYSIPLPLGEYGRPQYPQQPQCLGGGEVALGSPALKKFSSHGNVFHSNLEGPLELRAPEPHGVSHGSMPSLELQMVDAGGRVAEMRRVGSSSVGGGGRMSPGTKYANAGWNWSGTGSAHMRQHNPSLFGKDGYYSTPAGHNQFHIQAQDSAKPKETQRLNKFPLDLDNLVGTSGSSMGPTPASPPVQPPRSLPIPLQCPSGPPSGPTSPLASLSSLDSANTTPLRSSPHSPPSYPPGSFPVPDVSRSPVPFSPAQTPRTLDLLSRSQVATARPSPTLVEMDVNQTSQEVRESVGSILQRIASFSSPDAAPATALPQRRILSNGVKRKGTTSPMLMYQECVPIPMPALVPLQIQGPKREQDKTKELETETFTTPMEDRQAEEMGPDAGLEGKEGKKISGDKRADETAEDENVDEDRGMEKIGLEEGEERKKAVEMEGMLPPCSTVGSGLQGSIKGSDLFGYVGIEAVLDQMRRKTMKAGFEFNVMVVGQSGLGKSTLVNTLFKSKVSRKSCTPNYEEKIYKTVKLQSVSHVIEENGVKMKLTVIDTPGFGDQINNENCWEPIVKYVNEQYEKYLKEELHINRKRRIPDTRVHCCIYFLPATGHWLRPIDVEFMKRLGKIVSIVPVIAKADTLTIEERLGFKQRIRQDLQTHGIRVYPEKEYDEDTEDRILNNKIRESIPFAVVGTDKEHQVNGNKVLGRKTKWGIIEVENVAHCEFSNLRDLLIRSHLQDLKGVTHYIHYETYRVRRLNESNMNVSALGLSSFPLENGTSDTESHL